MSVEPLALASAVIVEPADDSAWMYVEFLRGCYAAVRAEPIDVVALAAGARLVILECGVVDDGVGLCRALVRQYPSLAVLSVTSRIEVVVPSFEAGCHSVMIKPVHRSAFVRRVQSLLTGSPRVLARQLRSECTKCCRHEGEAFDESVVGGTWLMCRPCGHVWLDPTAGARRGFRLVAE